MKKYVFDSANSFRNTMRVFPILTFITFFINSLFIIYKGSPQLDLDEIEAWKASLISIGIASGTALLSWYVYLPYAKKRVEQFFSRNETETEEGRVEEIELSSRTNSYIDVVENKADTTPSPNSESVVDDEGEEIQFKYDIDTTDENIKNSKFTTELEREKLKNMLIYTTISKMKNRINYVDDFKYLHCFRHGSNDAATLLPRFIYETNEKGRCSADFALASTSIVLEQAVRI